LKELSKNRLKFLHKLNQKKYRDSENLFIISGLRAVKTTLENPNTRLVECIYSKETINLAEEILKKSGHDITQSFLSEKDFSKLVDEKTPQGVCLVVQKPATKFLLEKVSGNFLLFLDRINDPGNLGTIIRSAEWFGFKTLLLSNHSADPFQPKVVRSSVGTLLNISIFENVESDQLIELKTELGYTVYATDTNNGNDISQFKFSEKSIIMMGSEAHGLNPLYQSLYNEKISITGKGDGESLNLANAASIIMYQAVNNQ